MRTNLFKFAALGALAGVVIAALCAFAMPERTTRTAIDLALKLTRLDSRVQEMPFGPVHYLIGGQGETVVFLHGIYSSKETWIRAGNSITLQNRSIIPDIPGFGENDALPDDGYRIEAQAVRLMQFLDAIGVKRFHVAGSSMGGMLATLIARDHPARVLSLSLFGSPMGAAPAPNRAFQAALGEGSSPLIVENSDDVWERFDWIAEPTPLFFKWVARGLAEREIATPDLNHRIWNELFDGSALLLADIAKDVPHPTFIVWCDEDRIYDVSGAAYLASQFQRGHHYILNGCGHSPVLSHHQPMIFLYQHVLDQVRATTFPFQLPQL